MPALYQNLEVCLVTIAFLAPLHRLWPFFTQTCWVRLSLGTLPLPFPPLKEEEVATHSSILAWKIPWAEIPGGLQSMGSQRGGHDWATEHTHHLKCSFLFFTHIFIFYAFFLKYSFPLWFIPRYWFFFFNAPLADNCQYMSLWCDGSQPWLNLGNPGASLKNINAWAPPRWKTLV